MRHVDAALVPMADRVGGTGHRSLDTERTTCATHEGRLTRAELTRDGHDITGMQICSEPCSDLLGLFRRTCFDQNSPSCTAGSATAGGA